MLRKRLEAGLLGRFVNRETGAGPDEEEFFGRLRRDGDFDKLVAKLWPSTSAPALVRRVLGSADGQEAGCGRAAQRRRSGGARPTLSQSGRRRTVDVGGPALARRGRGADQRRTRHLPARGGRRSPGPVADGAAHGRPAGTVGFGDGARRPGPGDGARRGDGLERGRARSGGERGGRPPSPRGGLPAAGRDLGLGRAATPRGRTDRAGDPLGASHRPGAHAAAASTISLRVVSRPWRTLPNAGGCWVWWSPLACGTTCGPRCGRRPSAPRSARWTPSTSNTRSPCWAPSPRRASSSTPPWWWSRRRWSTRQGESGALYVALTRCVQELTVVHRSPLPRCVGGAQLFLTPGEPASTKNRGAVFTSGASDLAHRSAPSDSRPASAGRRWCCAGSRGRFRRRRPDRAG